MFEESEGISTEELAALVTAAERSPKVTAHGVGPEGDLPAAMLAWGYHLSSGRWAAGVSFLYHAFRGAPIHALVTVWLPSMQVTRVRGQTYGTVPRVRLAGAGPEEWPVLPPVYPGASEHWTRAHHHAFRVDPARRYGLVPAPARPRRDR